MAWGESHGMTPTHGGRCTSGKCGTPKPKPSVNDKAAYERLLKALQGYIAYKKQQQSNLLTGQNGGCNGSMPYGCGIDYSTAPGLATVSMWQKILVAAGIALPAGFLCLAAVIECTSAAASVGAGVNATLSGDGLPEGVGASTALVRDADKWPLYRGFLGGYSEETHLEPGTLIDRFGSDYGTFFAPAGSSLPGRAMHPSTLDGAYNVYRVTNKGLTVQGGLAQPYFGQPGLGIQYESSMNVKDLLEHGYIKRVTDGE